MASTLVLAMGPVKAQVVSNERLVEVPATVVSATRWVQPWRSAPVSATVITAADIERSGVTDANEAVRKLGGVVGRSDLNGGRELSLDLRGYGETASQNIVVLLDGIRLSENENVSARLSAIPLSRIERIEVVRGGSSVLWGEGASAGVINVVLKHGDATVDSARVLAAVESFGGWELSASGQRTMGAWTLDAHGKKLRSDGYRKNSYLHQDSSGLGIQWNDGPWAVSWRVMTEDQSTGLPGALKLSDAQDDPRQSGTPKDYDERKESRHLARVTWRGENVRLELDAGYRHRETGYEYVRPGSSKAESSSDQWQLSPRFVWSKQFDAARWTATGGVDWLDWDFESASSFLQETGSQHNVAAYVQSELALPSDTRIAVGMRHERVEKSAMSSSSNYTRNDKLKAGELGVSQGLFGPWSAYGRVASSYRLANVDENRQTPGQAALLPQENRDREIGVRWEQSGHSATARYFHQKTRDEILYVLAPLFANTNIDPVLRKGVELEFRWLVSTALRLSGTAQHLSARFDAGPNKGKDLVAVSPTTATLRAHWQVDDRQSFEMGVQYLSKARYPGDESNLCSARLSSSTLVDGRYVWRQQGWTVALAGSNLADRQGNQWGYASAGCLNPVVYPYAGRSLRLSVERSF
jgi:iron complex outermembrane receptor protein